MTRAQAEALLAYIDAAMVTALEAARGVATAYEAGRELEVAAARAAFLATVPNGPRAPCPPPPRPLQRPTRVPNEPERPWSPPPTKIP